MASMALPRGVRPARRRIYRAYLLVLFVFVLAYMALRIPTTTEVLQTAGYALPLVIVLALVADTPLFTVGMTGRPAWVSGSVLFTFTILLEWARGTALWTQTIVVVIGGLLARRRPWQIIFDVGRYGVAIWAAARVLRLGTRPYLLQPSEDLQLLIVFGATVVWFLAFHVLTTTEAWLRTGEPWASLSRRRLVPEAVTATPLLLMAPLLVGVLNLNPGLVVLVLAPLFTVSRMTRLAYEQAQQNRTDPLTRLPNRAELARRVTARIAGRHPRPGRAPGAAPPTGRFALLVLDMDRFRYVNEALGHDVGDRVLVEVAGRLARMVGPNVTVARLGGDEFGVFAPDVTDLDAARELSRQLCTGLTVPITIDDLPLVIGASAGIALYPDHGGDITTLLRNADTAMHSAKAGNEQTAVAVVEADPSSTRRLRLVSDLRNALTEPGNSEIEVCYQPQVMLDTGALVGVEALLRWRHPHEGAVSPEEIIRAAEHTGIMGQLTQRVIEDVLAASSWWETQDLHLRSSINVSVRDLYGSAMVDWLADRIRRYDLSPGQIQLEITESALMADPSRVLVNLDRLHKLGIALALDDFGTGYSSMQHLRRLPVSEVKIDRSFVQSMVDSPDDDAIVRSIIGLSRELGMRVVAEGVEDERTARMLNGHGCHVGQGWLYGRAMPARDLLSWLARYRSPDRLLEARRMASVENARRRVARTANRSARS